MTSQRREKPMSDIPKEKPGSTIASHPAAGQPPTEDAGESSFFPAPSLNSKDGLDSMYIHVRCKISVKHLSCTRQCPKSCGDTAVEKPSSYPPRFTV